jgi:hypothetical protein
MHDNIMLFFLSFSLKTSIKYVHKKKAKNTINDLQNNTKKTDDWATGTLHKPEVNLHVP